jgi:formate hydrogenlyase transcriptional activator
VFPVTLPPLRERGDDIPLLVEHFVQKFAERQGKEIVRIPEEVMEILQRHTWPGNIRELQNVIERGVVMTTGPVLSLRTTAHMRLDEGIAQVTAVSGDAEPTPVKTLVDAERAHIQAMLRETNWVVGGARGAAAQLGLPRTTLIARMQRLGISSGTFGKRAGQPNRQFVPVASAPTEAAAGVAW